MAVDKALSLVDRRHNMNPVQYWYDAIPFVREAMDGYFVEHIDLINETRLRGDLVELYQNHTAIDKTLTLSLLGYYGVLFDEPWSK